MSSIVQILFFSGFCASAVQAIELPGHCPLVPPTHFPRYFRESSEIVLGFPFSIERPSHIFKPFDSINLVGFFSFSISENSPDTFKITYEDSKFVVRGNLTTYETTKDQSLWLTSHLKESLIACEGVLTEDIRMWFEDDLLIIWSCTNNVTGDTHDEAALFVVEAPNVKRIFIHESPDEFKIMRSLVKALAQHYLNNSLLLDSIDWQEGTSISADNSSRVEFQCQLVPQLSKGPLQLLLLNLITVLILVLVAAKVYSRNDGRVGPDRWAQPLPPVVE